MMELPRAENLSDKGPDVQSPVHRASLRRPRRARRRPDRRDRGGRAGRPAEVDRRPAARVAGARRRRRAGPGRHALPARAAAGDAGGADPAGHGRWPGSRGRRWRSSPARPARRPGCPCATARWPTTSTRSAARTRSRSATGPGRGSRCTRSRPARSCWRTRRRRSCSATSAGRWSRSRARTLVTADALLERMRAIRRDGYTWALEEFDEGISSVAAPVADANGEVVAALHLHGPSYRFPAAGRRGAAGRAGRRVGGADLGEPAPGGLSPGRSGRVRGL